MNALFIILAATIPLRNPFWPVGWTGDREAITDEPRFAVKSAQETTQSDDTMTSVNPETIALAAAQAQANDSEHTSKRLWIEARKTLKFGATMKAQGDGTARQSIIINGRTYADGDLISINYESRRFTWRVKGLTGGGTLKLQRIRYRDLDEEDDDTTERNDRNVH